MTVGILLVTHGPLGRHLLDTVTEMIGRLPLQAEAVEVHNHQDPETRMAAVLASATRVDQGKGVLILTDAFGSTPSNISARAAQSRAATRVVAGLNLPMLVRVCNYPQLTLDAMTESAIDGGRQGILCGDAHAR